LTNADTASLPPQPPLPLREPWRPDSLLSVARNPQLVWLFVQSELGNPYQGTLLGKAWDYVRPLMRFFVYFVVIGLVLGLQKSVPNFGIYVFSGVATVQTFNGAVTKATRSLSKNSTLIRRVNVPIEALPIASVIASTVREKAALLILIVASVLTGWRPNHLIYVPYCIGGIVLLLVFASGLGMITAVAAMYVKDTQYAVQTLTMLVRWASPVIYPWMLVEKILPPWLTTLYLSNPVTVALFGVRETFWVPTVGAAAVAEKMKPLPTLPIILSIVITIGTLLIGQWLMRRTQHRVASRVKWS
jgi:ABC-2 type transport system permease protein